MKIISTLFDKVFCRKKTAKFDAWLHTEIDETKIRNLVKVRIKYVDNPKPEKPDLNELLEAFIHTKEQNDAITKIWKDEVTKYLLHNSTGAYE